jgi:HAMP domain-containing protein
MNGDSARRIEELERSIADLKARLPRHSVPASMLIELDDLEEELEHLQAEIARQEE